MSFLSICRIFQTVNRTSFHNLAGHGTNATYVVFFVFFSLFMTHFLNDEIYTLEQFVVCKITQFSGLNCVSVSGSRTSWRHISSILSDQFRRVSSLLQEKRVCPT